MKEGKTTKSNAKKKTNNHKSSHDGVRITKVSPVEENFLEESEDKRLIAFIAVAILVIVGTVIGLLVGFQKEEEPEPEKPKDDIVVPIDNNEEEKNNDEGVKTTEIVRKVLAISNDSEEDNNSNEEVDVEDVTKDTYSVTFDYTSNTEVIEVEKDTVTEAFTPVGYNNCLYYSNEERTEEFDFSTVISEDTTIYTTCSLITYTIDYDQGNPGNPEEYTVENEDFELLDLLGISAPFMGWYAEAEFTNKIEKLSKDIVQYADENNFIQLYGKVASTFTIVYVDENDNDLFIDDVPYENATSYTIVDFAPYCDNDDECLGWKDQNSNQDVIISPSTVISVENDMIFELVKSSTSDPTNQNDTSDSTNQNDTSDPTNQNDTSDPTNQNDTSDPANQNDTSNPANQNDTSDPTNQNDTSNPTNQNDTSDPANQNDTSDPTNQNDTSDPINQNNLNNPE